MAGEAATFPQTFELVDSLHPDIVVFDLHMPGERNYLAESAKVQVLENVGCILGHLHLERFRGESWLHSSV